MTTRKKVIISIAVLFILIAGVMLFRNQGGAFGTEKKKVATEAVNNKISVKVQQADLIEKTSGIEFKASLEASDEGIISSKVGGTVVQILFEAGKYIFQGEPLIKLDDKEAKNNLKAAETQLNVAENQLKATENQLIASQMAMDKLEINLNDIQKNYDRTKALFEQGASSKVELERAELQLNNAKSDFQSAKVSVEASKIAIETSKANILTALANVDNIANYLANTIINAPISGVIDEKSVNIGQYVNQGTILGKVKNISPINAVIEVEQNNLDNIKVGQKAQVKIGESNTKVYEGIVKNIDVSADPSSRVFKCKLQLDNKDQALKPGIFAKAEILNNQKVEMMAVPIEALAGNEGNYYLYINDSGVARKRKVTIGETDKNVVEIKSGVQKAESVICTNVNTLQDGDTISVVSE